jgi:putative ABC transport system permease protein
MTRFPRSLRVYRLLLGVLPHLERQRDQLELEAAFDGCVEREHRRLGAAGLVYAWLRMLLDLAGAAILLRFDARGRRRVAALNHPPELQGDSLMTNLWQDVRYSARVLTRAPGFSAVVIVTLALAIGASTGVFSVVNAVLLRSLPFPEPERLVVVYEGIPQAFSGPIGFSAPDFRGFEQRARSFTALAAFRNKDFELSGVSQPERVTAARASAALFDVLAVHPAIGQAFSRDDDEGRRPVAVLSDGLWRRKFGADPAIVGRAIILDRVSYTVLGVMPRSFTFPNRGPLLNNQPADLFVPISYTDLELNGFAMMYNNTVVGRLRQGVTLAQAHAESRTIAERLVREIYPAEFQQGFAVAASVVALRDETVGRIERVLYVLLASVGVVLLIACVDIATLMLTRAAARSRELAVRSALGAGRAQLARQVLVESGLLSICGGALGVLVAYWSSTTLARVAPPTIPRLNEMTIDLRVLGFAALVSMTTALLCGLPPALEIARRPSGEALKEGAHVRTPSVRQKRMFGALVIAQFALAVILLIAGGLLTRSFSRLMDVDPGFRAERALTLATSLPASAYRQGSEIRAFYQQLLERVGRLPGVSAAAAVTDLPLSVRERRAFLIESQPSASADVPHVVAHDWTIGRYFEAMGVNLVRGRFLSEQDTPQSEPVIAINQTMAQRFWPGEDPVGRRIAWGSRPQPQTRWMRIVGIVADVKQGPLNTETFPQTYQPWVQVDDRMIADNVIGALRSLTLVARTDADPLATAAAIKAEVRAIDPSLPVAQVRTMTAVVSESVGPQRFNTLLLGGFAGVALVLAALGIGGVLATAVSRRTQEIGLRMALGAGHADLRRMVIGQGMTLVIVGMAIGVPAAFVVTRFMSSLLFGIKPHDPVTFAGATTVLLLVALLACYLPARRATRIDPIAALRCQ